MRTFNVRLAGILLAVVVVFGVGVYFLHAAMVEKNAKFFLEEAERAEGDVEKAVKEKNAATTVEDRDQAADREEKAKRDVATYLGRYIRLNPKADDEREKLGMFWSELAWEDNGIRPPKVKDLHAFSYAIAHLEEVARHDPSRKRALLQLTKMKVAQHRFADAEEHLQDLLMDLPKDVQKGNPQSAAYAEYLRLRARCQIATQKYPAALETLKKAIAWNPSELAAYGYLGEVLRSHLQQPKEADRWIKRMVDDNPKSAEAHLRRGRYLAGLNQADEAQKEAAAAVQLTPDDPDMLLFAAQVERAMRHLDKAREYATRGMKNDPKNIAMYLALADIEMHDPSREGLKSDAEVQARNYEKAIRVYRQGLKANDKNVERVGLILQLADALIDRGGKESLQEARDLVENQLRVMGVRPELADYLSARIHFADEHWKMAAQAFERARGGLQGDHRWQADYNLGRCYAHLGNPDQQLLAFRRAVEDNPFHPASLLALIETLQGRGRAGLDEAIQVAKQAVEQGRHGPEMELVLLGLVVDKIQQVPPAQRDWKWLEGRLAALEKSLPNSATLPRMRANVLIAQNRQADADKLLRETAENCLREPGGKNKGLAQAYWAMRVSLAAGQSHWEDVEKLLQEWEKLFGDSAQLRLFQAQMMVRRDAPKADEAKRKELSGRVAKLTENADKLSDNERLQLWAGLAEMSHMLGDRQQAVALCKKVVDKQPLNLEIRHQLFQYTLQGEDPSALDPLLADIEKLGGRGPDWLYDRAMLIVVRATKEHKKDSPLLDEALDCLSKAREGNKQWSRIPLLMARIYELQGKPDSAIASYREAIALGERNADAVPGKNIVNRLVELLIQRGRTAEIATILQRLAQDAPLSPDLIQIQNLLSGDPDTIRQEALKVLTSKEKDYGKVLRAGYTLTLLGNQTKESGQREKADGLYRDAEKAFRAAVEIEPKRTEAWIGLVDFYHNARQDDEKADATRQEAAKAIPEKDALLALAKMYEVMGKIDDAVKDYEAAVDAAPQDVPTLRAAVEFYFRLGRFLPAEKGAQKIFESKSPQPEDLAWARRILVPIYLQRGGHENLVKAKELNEQNLASAEKSREDERHKLIIMSYDPSRAVREEAAQKLKEWLDKDPRSAAPEDRLRLARMYLEMGNWPAASEQFLALIAAQPQEQRYLIYYVDCLLQRTPPELSNAEAYLDRLERFTPVPFPTLRLRAEWYFLKKQPDQCYDVIEQYLNRADAMPKDADLRKGWVGDLLSQFSRRLTAPGQKPLAEKFAKRGEELFRAFVKAKPGQELELVKFLARAGKLDESLHLLDQSLDASTPQDFRLACSYIAPAVRDNGTKEQLAKLDEIVRRGTNTFGRPLMLLSLLAELRVHQGKYAEAEGYYREVLKQSPDDYRALNNLAVLLALQGVKLDEAIGMINRALELGGPTEPSLLDSRATIYTEMGETDKALQDLDEVLKNQESPVRLFHQAIAYRKARRDSDARASFDKALKKGLTKTMLDPLEFTKYEQLQQLPR